MEQQGRAEALSCSSGRERWMAEKGHKVSLLAREGEVCSGVVQHAWMTGWHAGTGHRQG